MRFKHDDEREVSMPAPESAPGVSEFEKAKAWRDFDFDEYPDAHGFVMVEGTTRIVPTGPPLEANLPTHELPRAYGPPRTYGHLTAHDGGLR